MAEFEDTSGDRLTLQAYKSEVLINGHVGDDHTAFFFPPATARAIAAALIKAADEAEAME